MTKYTHDQITKACDMRERGISAAVIENVTGIKKTAVEYHLLRLGADSPKLVRNLGRRPRPWTRNGYPCRPYSEDDDAYITASADTMRLSDMARHLDRTPSSVRNRILLLERIATRREALAALEAA